MKQVKINIDLFVSDSLGSEIKEKGLTVSKKDHKYVVKVGDTIVPLRDASVTVDAVRVSTHQRSKKRDNRN